MPRLHILRASQGSPGNGGNRAVREIAAIGEGPEAHNNYRERFRSLNKGVRINQPDLYGLVRVLC